MILVGVSKLVCQTAGRELCFMRDTGYCRFGGRGENGGVSDSVVILCLWRMGLVMVVVMCSASRVLEILAVLWL